MFQKDLIIAVERILPVCLLKVADEEIGKRALGGGAKIEEDEVDTLLQLRDEKYEELVGVFARFFTKDALKCLKKNYASLKKGVILISCLLWLRQGIPVSQSRQLSHYQN